MNSKLAEIVNGWKNVIFTDPKVEKLALERAKICSRCTANVHNICTECGCPLVAKTRSTKSTTDCPLRKWDKLKQDGNIK